MNIKRPTLLVNESIARENIARMVNKTKLSGVELIPHFKTPQSLRIGQWFSDAGVNSITVSSVTMARYFQKGGWKNITIAFPLNIHEIEDIAQMALQTNLTLLINEEKQIEFLINKVTPGINVLIEIDCGSHRSGIDPSNPGKIEILIKMLKNSQHIFQGFYSHFGHTYKAHSEKEILDIYNSSFSILLSLQDQFFEFKPQLSIGDTPSASVLTDFERIKSLHAGNFVFNDLMQTQIGSCTEKDIAVVLACPVVSKNPGRNELVVYGGGIHLSKDSLFDKEFNSSIFGKPVRITPNGWSESLPASFVKSLSQEHGIIQLNAEDFQSFDIGDVIGILPVHSCMTADAMGEYLTLAGVAVDHM